MFRQHFSGNWHDCGQFEINKDRIYFKFELKKPTNEELIKIINTGQHFYTQCAINVTPQLRCYLFDPDSSDDDSDSDDEVIQNPSASSYFNKYSSYFNEYSSGYSVMFKFEKPVNIEQVTVLLESLNKMRDIDLFISASCLEKIKKEVEKVYNPKTSESKSTQNCHP